MTAADRSDHAPRAMLTALCDASRHPSHDDEPVCRVRESLGDDDAWLVLWNACRASDDAGVSPCPEFRQEAGGVLIYHASTNTWNADWEERAWPLAFDVAGTPTLRLKPRDSRRLHIVVDEISPMTYAALPGTPTEHDISVMPGLETLLELAGAGVQTAIASFAAGRPSAGDVTRGEAPAFACAPDATAIAAELRAHGAKADVLIDDLGRLTQAMEAVDQRTSAFIRVLQRAERGEAVSRADFVRPDAGAVETAATAVDAAAASLSSASRQLASCDDLMTAYTVLLDAGGATDAVPTLTAQVHAAAATCRTASLRESVLADARALATCGAALPQAMKARAAAVAPYLKLLAGATARDDKLQAAAGTILDMLPAARGAADRLAAEIDRAERHTWRGVLVRQLVVSRPNPTLGWNKIQSHAIVLTADSPYLKDIALAHEKQESHPYRIASATGDILGYGIGVVYTPLHETTWTAAASPNGRGKVIAEHERTSRAGDLAAFLSYRVLEHWPRRRASWIAPTADAGIGLTSGTLAFFLGGGVELFHAARLGGGWSPQRVSVLAPGQVPGVTPVSSADDIRTINHFETHNWYLSFSFALDSVSLFRGRN